MPQWVVPLSGWSLAPIHDQPLVSKQYYEIPINTLKLQTMPQTQMSEKQEIIATKQELGLKMWPICHEYLPLLVGDPCNNTHETQHPMDSQSNIKTHY